MAAGLTLVTARLELRPLTAADLGWLHALWTLPLVRQYLWDGMIVSRERAAEELARGTAYWAVGERGPASQVPIGFCGFRPGEGGDPELLFALDPRFWNRGLAAEAAHAVLEYGFAHLGFERVIAGTDSPNTASLRVIEKLGMRFDHAAMNEGRPEAWFVLTREDFSALPPPPSR